MLPRMRPLEMAALFNPTFFLGVVVLLYLSSFVLFAVVRITTGLSIQRVGYFSLRRLAYVPRDGFKIEIRGLGLNVHRPTFAQPTWLSIVVSELVVTINIRELEGGKTIEEEPGGTPEDDESRSTPRARRPRPVRQNPPGAARSQTWQQLMKLKERIKRLHRNVNWLRMVDVVATNSTINIADVGSVQFGAFTIAVDTRRKMVDRARFFRQSRNEKRREKQQAEWIMTLRSVLFTPEGKDSMEILDNATLNVHGFLYEALDGLRDAAVALKLGRVHLPYDDFQLCAHLYAKCRAAAPEPQPDAPSSDVFGDNVLLPELDVPGGTDDDLMQAVSDSKEFVSSILRGIKEVQFAVSFMGMTKKVEAVDATGSPALLNASMKEVGIDLHRLDPRSPAHRMYFPSKDIAHEALAAALSISVGVDDGHGRPQRLVYIPMATTTVKTTLPSKTVELTGERSAEERNANILFANSVVTSPSVDLDPRHLPLLLAMLQPRPTKPRVQPQRRHMLISRLLPKASIKLSMHEPVIRIALPPVQKTADTDDFDLIISSISSVSLDIESSHSAVEELHYSLASTMRVQTHHLYYQTSGGGRFDLLQTEAFDLKVQLSASPEVHIVASGNLQTFSLKMVRPEISDGLQQIVRQLRLNVEPDKRATSKTPRHANFLRAIPAWLLHCQIHASDFSIEVAGVDEDIGNDTRGVALQLESWSAEYRAQRLDGLPRRPSRRRAPSRSMLATDAELLRPVPVSPRKKYYHPGDGRRVAIHVRGLEAFIVESSEKWEIEPFLGIPRLEIAFSTLSDNQGPVFHVHSHVRTLLAQYSLYRHYTVGVAAVVVRKVFLNTSREATSPQGQPRTHHLKVSTDAYLGLPPSPDYALGDPHDASKVSRELVAIDIKAALVQIKADMPADPPLMLQIYSMEAGRHRWSPPFFQSKLIRLYAEAPRMRRVWARALSIKNGRLDYRESRRKGPSGLIQEERMFDVTTEAIRLAVPHELVISKVSDNLINVFKAVQQLHHRFRTGTNEYILGKGPEGPRHTPKVSLRTRTLLFELEDGAFEWKLGMIYRAGRVEQMQRLAREEAFRVKVKKVHDAEARKDSNKFRTRSVLPRGRSATSATSWTRSRSEDGRPRSGAEPVSRGRAPRYDPEGSSLGMTGAAQISIAEARQRLHLHNADSWKQRIDRHYVMARNGMRDIRGIFWGPDHIPDDIDDHENVLEVPHRPALMSALISDLHVSIDKPSFAIKDLPDFLHRTGKGLPRDMAYSLLVPMNVQVEMGEAKVSLRDYPLPLLHVPPLKPGQSPRLHALSMKTDFVIAEEFRGPQSTRRVRVNIIPPQALEPGKPSQGSFAIDVRRTIGPVKSYSDIQVDINTALPTRITWGPSYQPAIQDMMMVIESFTKPQLDPSEHVGFWDKIRLNFHSRIRVAWKSDGDVHLALKGTRDPYQVTGNGAGFLMCWRNDVRWNVHADDDPKKFMTVDSGEYVLAVPDYSQHAREASPGHGDEEIASVGDGRRSGAAFKKVVMKLSGKVQWLAGLVFERAIEDSARSFDFIPHYNVVLKSPQFAQPEGGLPYDAFRGFRSQHIHMSLAVRAPVDRAWSSSQTEPSRSYNTVHLTPRFFTHFFAWWSLFGGPLSLPIRQGQLFPGREKSSKKFGRHLATIKYNLLLAPFFLSHIYRHKDAEDPIESENATSATGIKVRFDSFVLDLHQRREEFNTRDRGRKTQSRTTGMKIHAGQLDLASADIRAVSASIGSSMAEVVKRHSKSLSAQQREEDNGELSRFTIPDNDFSWIDMDDFVELDWILPSEASPDTKILPLAFAPRITYFRQTDIGGVIAGDPDRTSPFGREPTHLCIMSQDDDPSTVQMQLIRDRLGQLQQQIDKHVGSVGEAELRMVRDGYKDPALRAEFEALTGHSNVLQDKQSFLERALQQMAVQPGREDGQKSEADSSQATIDLGAGSLSVPSGAEFASEFKNRFVIHNMQLKWNNLLRNIILRYIHQVSQRRGFVYYLSRPAVKFILDIVEEQTKLKAPRPAATASPTPGGGVASSSEPGGPDKDIAKDIEERIRKILHDGRKFVNADDDVAAGDADAAANVRMDDLTGGIAAGFAPQRSYHVRLIAPQIQLQSDKNKKHVVLVTAKGMELKVVEVLDKKRISDIVSGLVQRRFLVSMDSTQFFVTHQKWFSTQLLSMYSGSTYGTPNGSSWPPWVPLEVVFDFQTDPFGFKRVVQKTSAMLRYDKYNTLRLKYNDEVNTGEGAHTTSSEAAEKKMDNLWVEFPQARALCNSSQYYAIYVIVLDLLMYNEPLEKTRSERLEKIMLASDFSDLRGAPEMVTRLQERIRQLEDIKTHFQIHSKYLGRRGWEDRAVLERDLAACEDELFFMMKAITTSQRRYDAAQSNALLRWTIAAKDIVWHLIRDNNEPLVELQLKDVEYDRTDNSDGSHINLLRVGRILGLNLLPDAIYPEMVAPYLDERGPPEAGTQPMIRVYWYMLEAIAGIPVMDHFEVNLFPMKIQLEREVGKKLFDYIFPGLEGDRGDASRRNDSPFMLKQAAPGDGDGEDDAGDQPGASGSSISRLGSPGSDKDREGVAFSTRPGSLELRLRPTLTSEARSSPPKHKALSVHSGEGHSFRLFRSSGSAAKAVSKKPSWESLRGGPTPRPGVGRSSTGFSSLKDGSSTTTGDSRKVSRFALRSRAASDRDDKASDDLTKMMARASSYMTFSYIKMPSVVLCLSYKGKGDRNIEDVHDFVFRLPTIEYRNKTWSNLDLALALKSRVIKALISHTGAIIGNKFSRHRPSTAQQSKLRELASSSVLLATPAMSESRDNSDDSSSLFGTSPVDFSRSPPRSLRGSQTSIPGPSSRSSSVASSRSHRSNLAGGGGLAPVPSFLMMTPPTPQERVAGSGPPTFASAASSHAGLGIDLLRPPSRSSSINGGSEERRKSAIGGMRDKLSALTARLKDRDATGPGPSLTQMGQQPSESRPIGEQSGANGNAASAAVGEADTLRRKARGHRTITG